MSERKGTKGLELWCRRMTEGYPGVNVVNMTTSWRDGLAFCAIIHHFRPDLIEFSKLNKDDIYHNNDLAFRTAERHLGIPALLEPEDMVEFAVPDRLSILTYLSQFYQTFVVSQGKSPARIAAKRAATSPERSLVSPASSSPPTKVALPSAGKIRREPCAKCGLPVFIAERLNVGKLLYHRTCFRCARCNSQLTLANYYETESNEFCCETCPDEEKSHFNLPDASVLTRSLSDEEKSATLKKSEASDDYSTKFETALEYPRDDSLKRSSTLNSSQFREARSFFFNSQVEGVSDSGNEDEPPPDLPKTKPPARAENVTFGKSFSDSSFPKDKLETNVNIGSSVSLSSPSAKLEKSHDIVTKDTISAEGNTNSLVKARMRLFETKSDAPNETHSVNNKVPSSISNSAVEVGRNNKEDSKHSFKDNTSNKNTSRESLSLRNSPEKQVSRGSPLKQSQLDATEKISVIEISDDSIVTISDDTETNLEETKTSENTFITSCDISMKSEETSDENKKSPEPFEKTPAEIKRSDVPSKRDENPEENKIIHQNQLNVVRTSPEKVKPLIAELKSSPKFTSHRLNIVRESPEKVKPQVAEIKASPNVIHEVFNVVVESPGKVQPQVAEIKPSSNVIYETVTVVEESPEEVTPKVAEIEPSPSVVSQTLNVVRESPEKVQPQVAEIEASPNVIYEALNVVAESPEKVKPQVAEIKASPNVIYQTSFLSTPPEDKIWNDDSNNTNEYPDDLNPFGDDEDAEPQQTSKKTANISLNPFEDEEDEAPVSPSPKPATRKRIKPSSGDADLSPVYIERVSVNPFEEDEDVEEKTAPQPTTRKVITAPKISLNPFWSDDEENDETKPVPKPRLSKTSGAPEPKPRELDLSASTNFGSSSSVTSSQGGYTTLKKKKPAPRPPLLGGTESGPSSLTSSPSHSVTHSPRSTPKIRKNKKAPLPPTSTPIHKPSAPLDIDIEDDFGNEKIAKDEQNRNRQSQNMSLQSPSSSDNSSSLSVPNKSTHGKWKRKKGLAPSRPIPQRRTTQSLPLVEVRRELELIEIQQQGLEKQGVRLEQIIRERCEGPEVNPDDCLSPEIEEMVLQLFELVNEKNELFRRQAELMYLRRQHKLEEEHADIEYQIRCLMLQPEANKTDSDKAREEELINRLVEIVERRNEIIECLEMDRVREAEEDDSINNQLNLYTLKKEEDKASDSKNSKKEKKKHKKEKKSKLKGSKIDADKDIDESEGSTSSVKDQKKKKKFNLF